MGSFGSKVEPAEPELVSVAFGPSPEPSCTGITLYSNPGSAAPVAEALKQRKM